MAQGQALSAQMGLSKQEGTFVEAYARLGDLRLAVDAAGYVLEQGEKSNFGRHLLRRPRVTIALHAEIARLLQGDASIARAVALEMMQDKSVSARVRGDLAMRFLQLAGHVVPKSPDIKPLDRELHEMSAAELRSIVAQYDDELARRAKPISGDAAHGAGQHIDMLE